MERHVNHCKRFHGKPMSGLDSDTDDESDLEVEWKGNDAEPEVMQQPDVPLPAVPQPAVPQPAVPQPVAPQMEEHPAIPQTRQLRPRQTLQRPIRYRHESDL